MDFRIVLSHKDSGKVAYDQTLRIIDDIIDNSTTKVVCESGDTTYYHSFYSNELKKQQFANSKSSTEMRVYVEVSQQQIVKTALEHIWGATMVNSPYAVVVTPVFKHQTDKAYEELKRLAGSNYRDYKRETYMNYRVLNGALDYLEEDYDYPDFNID